MNDIVIVALVSTVGGGFLTLLGGLATGFIKRGPDFQAALNAGFERLAAAQQAEMKDLRDQNGALMRRVDDMSQTIDGLTAHIDDLKALIQQQGLIPPPMPKRRQTGKEETVR